MFHHASARCPSERFYNPYIHKHSPDGIAMSSANPNAISDDVVQEPLPPPPLAISAAGRLCNAIVRRRRRAAKSIQMAALGKCGATQLLKNPPRSQCPAPRHARIRFPAHWIYVYIYRCTLFSRLPAAQRSHKSRACKYHLNRTRLSPRACARFATDWYNTMRDGAQRTQFGRGRDMARETLKCCWPTFHFTDSLDTRSTRATYSRRDTLRWPMPSSS